MSTQVILFLSTNPHGTPSAKLVSECAAIQRELTMARHGEAFRFESRWVAGIDELTQQLRELDPMVIHFSGHGSGSHGVTLDDEPGESRAISGRGLMEIVRAAARRVRLVVLNACHSIAQADVLCTGIDCVVGMDCAMGEAAARKFAVQFYGALGEQRSIGDAVADGRAALVANGLSDRQLPRCVTRNGVDADEVFLTGSARARASGTDPSPLLSPWSVVTGSDRSGDWAILELDGVRQRLRWIPPGTFMMGSPRTERGRFEHEGPQHQVTITQGYWLGEAPVTQALWLAVMGKNPSRYVGPDRPVELVSWDDCQVFLDRLNARVGGLSARLPTEAEWEHACRAGSDAATWIGDLSGERDAPELDSIAWYFMNHGRETAPVGRKTPNPLGLHDMLGNVWEWCFDDLRTYAPESAVDPWSRVQSADRVARGGSYRNLARHVRAASRYTYWHSDRYDNLGFRLAGSLV